ncbi:MULTISPECIES: hypothetical protein [Mammaliicoccus]|uniref:hypothetical protein n=1 Tax=Mammaliicoccus TaxID=2803850 RepID=UPI0018DDA72C|nr:MULTISPECIES: hypothetical protein [Mammaliicoccus]MCE5086085.1 hypothetical protein [Mammaliicoccus sciuri]QPW13420.1 hypothetical protein I7827_14035 [Mammaliicoccus sciuri]
MNDRVKSVKFEAHGSEFIFRLGKTCWGDEGIAVYQDGYYIGLIDVLMSDDYKDPLESVARRFKKDVSLLDEVYA